MSFQNATTALSNLTFMGISHNYGLDDVPETLHRAQLPALLIMPIDTQNESLFQESGRAFEGIAFSDGSKTLQYTLTHLLVIAPIQQGKGIRGHLQTLISLIDTYFSVLGADVKLNGTLTLPTEVKIEPGLYRVGNTQYIGCAFRHTWTLEV